MRLLSRLQPRPQSHVFQKLLPRIPGFPRGPPRTKEAYLNPNCEAGHWRVGGTTDSGVRGSRLQTRNPPDESWLGEKIGS